MNKNNMAKYKAMVIFDGLCVLCYASVKFIVKKDKDKNICFTSFDTPFAQKLLAEQNIDPKKTNSIILLDIDSGKIFTKSKAVLKLTSFIKGFSKISFIIIFVPRFIMDILYNLVAKYRYKIFGTLKECDLKSELKNRFIY